MIIRSVLLVFALVLAALPAYAGGPPCHTDEFFSKEFSRDIAGGRYLVGEDRKISARMRQSSTVNAELRILKSYRTKEYGSGLSFYFCDRTLNRGIRVSFGDSEKTDRLRLLVHRIGADYVEDEYLIAGRALSLSKADTNRVSFRKDSKGRLVIEVGGETFKLDPGFEINSVHVQIFCAKAWARFVEGELIS